LIEDFGFFASRLDRCCPLATLLSRMTHLMRRHAPGPWTAACDLASRGSQNARRRVGHWRREGPAPPGAALLIRRAAPRS
jgi:hypothetical protein